MGFFSTFEKQLDGKRRIVVPQEYRAQVSGPFEGVFCFPAISADCIEGGSQPLFDRYTALIEELPFGDPLRDDLETTVFGGLVRLSFDTAGRITLPDGLCDEFGIGTDVALVGMGDRFQIWALDRFKTQRAKARASAREGLAALRNGQRGGAAA